MTHERNAGKDPAWEIGAAVHAHDIHESMTVAYWMKNVSGGQPEYHINYAHEKFAILAQELGYEPPVLRIDPRVETPETQQSEIPDQYKGKPRP